MYIDTTTKSFDWEVFQFEYLGSMKNQYHMPIRSDEHKSRVKKNIANCKLKYNRQQYTCPCCETTIYMNNKARHISSPRHIKRAGSHNN